jgi:hypothetical protein
VNFVVNGHEQRVFNRTKAIREQPRSSQAVVPEDACLAVVAALNPSTGTVMPFVGTTQGAAEQFTLNDDKTEYTLTTPQSTELPGYSCILTLNTHGIIRVDEFLPRKITAGTQIPGCGFDVDPTKSNTDGLYSQAQTSNEDIFIFATTIVEGVKVSFSIKAKGRTYSEGDRLTEYISARFLSLVSALLSSPACCHSDIPGGPLPQGPPLTNLHADTPCNPVA